MPKFNDIKTFVTDYYRAGLKQGHSVDEIIDSFRHDPLPPELNKYDESQIRRHGQLIATQYLLALRRQQLGGLGPENF
jgi:hypothetical protein